MKRALSIVIILSLLCATAFAADEEKLIYAAKSGNLKTVQQYIDENYSPDTADKSGRTLIMLAVSAGRYNVAEYLLSKGANANRSDKRGYSLMHILAGNSSKASMVFMEKVLASGARTEDVASDGETPAAILIKKGNLAGVEMFLDKGDFTPDRNVMSVPAIVYAYKKGQVKIVKLLAEKGAKLNVYDEKRNPLLHLAVEKNDLDTVKYLAEKGALIDIKNQGGETPLLSAAGIGSLQMIQYLIGKDAIQDAVDSSGRNMLHWLASAKNSARIISALRFDSRVINKKDQSGMTPIAYAAVSKRWENIKPLAEIGGDINFADASGRSLLVMAIEGGSAGTAKFLIEKGADVKTADSSGVTPLHLVALNKGEKWDEVASLLIRRGCDVNASDSPGSSAAGKAIESGNTSCFKILAANGLNINFREKGSVPLLLYAYRNNRKGIAGELMKMGADIAARDSEGNSLLHVLAEKNDIQLYKSMAAYNFDLNVKNNSGKTPLLTAIEKGNFQFAQLLMNEKDKVSLDVKDASGMTVMHYLASMKGGDKLLADERLSSLPVTESDGSGRTPLAIAVHANLTANAGYFIERGADAAGEDWNGVKLVLVAYETNRIDLFNILVSGGAKTSELFSGNTLLHMAASANRISFIASLINGKADLNARNRDNKTAVMLASEKGYGNSVKVLASGGADLSLRDNLGETALYKSVRIGGDGGFNAADALIKGGAQVNDSSSAGVPVLHEAVTGAKFRFVTLLLNGGADPNMLNKKNESAILLLSRTTAAVKNEQYRLTQAAKAITELISKGGDPNIPDKYGRTPLDISCRLRSRPVVEALLKNGVRVNDGDQYGNTALKKVIMDFTGDYRISEKEKKGTLEIIDLLIKNGADINVKDKSGRTPLAHILREVNPKNQQKVIDIVPELMKRGALADIKDNDGKSASDYAAESRIYELKEMVR